MSVNLVCKIHTKILDSFCKTHDLTLCASCIPNKHRTCKDIVPLETAAKNVKTSTALTDVKETIDEALQNIKLWIIDRELVSKDIDEQERKTKSHIDKTRCEINDRLDDLQQKLLQELQTMHSDFQFRNEKIIRYLKAAEKDLNEMKEELFHLNELTSDVHVFLGTREVNKIFVERKNEVETELKYATRYSIEAEIEPEIKSLMNTVHQFGQISVHETVANLSFKEAKINQAQIHLPKIHTVSDIKLQLKQKFEIKKEGRRMWVSGCSVFPNGNVLITDYRGKEQIMEYSNKGEHIRDIPVSKPPFDLTVIDEDHVAVSFGFKEEFIDIINISKNLVEKKIKLKGNCYGVSYQERKLHIVVNHKEIVVVDTTGTTMNTIKCDGSEVWYLTTTKDRIYYTDNFTIHCRSCTGEEIWKLHDDSVEWPRGISVDNNQNLFVVGRNSNNLTVIQHDGKAFTNLLTKSDGLVCPEVVCFNKDEKVLFVANIGIGNAAFYQTT